MYTAAPSNADVFYGTSSSTPAPPPQALPPAATDAPGNADVFYGKPSQAPEVLLFDDAPEEYVFTAPEDLAHLGLVHDEEMHQEYSALARSMNLDQVSAQKLLDLHLRKVYGA